MVRLARRELVWINVTAYPTAEWIAQQITEAFPWNRPIQAVPAGTVAAVIIAGIPIATVASAIARASTELAQSFQKSGKPPGIEGGRGRAQEPDHRLAQSWDCIVRRSQHHDRISLGGGACRPRLRNCGRVRPLEGRCHRHGGNRERGRGDAARLPTLQSSREYLETGALMFFGPNFVDVYRRAADYLDKILRGAKPTDIPVEQPTKFELVVNLIAAEALGLDLPPTLLARADEVIK